MWQHIAIFNLKECHNPLHRLHSVPAIPESAVELHYFYLAAKYLQKTFTNFDSSFGVTTALQSAFDVLCQDLQALEPLGSAGSDTAGEQSPTSRTKLPP
jgi:hypothetical protein